MYLLDTHVTCNDLKVADYFKRGYNNMLGKVGKRSKLIDIENALKLANADGLVTFDEVRQNLKKWVSFSKGNREKQFNFCFSVLSINHFSSLLNRFIFF